MNDFIPLIPSLEGREPNQRDLDLGKVYFFETMSNHQSEPPSFARTNGKSTEGPSFPILKAKDAIPPIPIISVTTVSRKIRSDHYNWHLEQDYLHPACPLCRKVEVHIIPPPSTIPASPFHRTRSLTSHARAGAHRTHKRFHLSFVETCEWCVKEGPVQFERRHTTTSRSNLHRSHNRNHSTSPVLMCEWCQKEGLVPPSQPPSS